MNILGITGSLREGSFNRRLLQAAAAVTQSAGATVRRFELHDIPLYNGDLDGEEKPAAVEALRAAIADADGLLIASPEYNYGIPGVLKNAIDWVSRPAFKSVLAGRPTALLSASMSPVGGARMQAQLKNVLLGTLTPVYPAPEFLLPSAGNAFDEGGALTDPDARRRLERFVTGYLDWARGLRNG